MTQNEMMRVKETISILAAQKGCSVAHIRREMQASIDAAWDKAWTPGNLQAQAKWQQLFPGGKKPTVEEFIAVVSQKIAGGGVFPHLHT